MVISVSMYLPRPLDTAPESFDTLRRSPLHRTTGTLWGGRQGGRRM